MNAFKGCKYLSELYLPEGLQVIGGYSFSNIPSLEYVYIPSTVTTAYLGAFNGSGSESTKGINVEFGEGTTTIVENLFSDASYLRSLTMPDSISQIGRRAFSNCVNLNSISVAGQGPSGEGEARFPTSLHSIGESAF